ncbi:MAG: hypothetical protein IKE85_09885 [Mogibacterium sp.]|nr:hypothetical protein [Mogibacterium sp.]
MPLILLGLLLIIGIVLYSIVRYMNSDEEDHRSVRERYPHAFRPRENKGPDSSGEDQDDTIHAKGYVDTDNLRGDIDYMFRNIKEDIKDKAKQHGIDLDKFGRDPLKHNPFSENKSSEDDDDDEPIIFPTDNVEAEKNKRNIH